MDEKFWLDRWAQKEIGFHRVAAQPALVKFWPALQLPKSSTVLVPLCGMSADMVWLAEQGHTVIGVELSEVAINEFFSAQGIIPKTHATNGFTVYRSANYELWCGNFSKLPPEVLHRCNALYDRASLVALPANMQNDYAHLIATHLGRATTGLPPKQHDNQTQARHQYLLIALEFDQDVMPGPPFSMPQERISKLYGNAFDITCLERTPALDQNENLKSRGLTALTETCYRLTRKP